MKNPSSFDLIIPEEVEAKIRHLCSKVHDVEWSGTLFYTVEGSLDDGTFKAICKDICVMDIGTSGFTNFKDTADIINYRIEHGLLRAGIYEGLIHSHNHLAAFFSGVDVSTLVKEGSDLNHFLSLIVCNAGQYVARITRKLKKKIKAEALITLTESTEYKTFEDATITLSKGTPHQTTKVEEKEETVIEYFEMRINKTEVPEPFKELDERLDAIKKSKLNAKYTFSTPTYQSVNAHYNIPYREPNPKYEFATHQTSLPFEGYEEIEEGFNTPSIPDEEDKDIEFYQYEKVPFTIVKTLCTQLLTSSIIVSSDTNINLDNWVKKMDSIYEARFGDLKDSYTQCRLKNWIQTHTEAILCYTVDKKYEDTLAARYKMGHDYDYNDSDAFIHLYASDMITYLDSLPKSIVKDMMIEELINLMPEEYENFRDNC